MTKTYFKLQSTTDKAHTQQITERFYTVGYVPQRRTQLTIKGRWLEQIGIYAGSPIIIKIEQGKLMVEIDL